MPPCENNAEERFLAWLDSAVSTIAKFEAQARAVLKNGGGSAEYADIMLEKAEFIAELHDDARPYLRELRAEARAHADARLRAFSDSAERALNINSPFYMSALLFPENHKPGDPNNLELLSNEMRAKLL